MSPEGIVFLFLLTTPLVVLIVVLLSARADLMKKEAQRKAEVARQAEEDIARAALDRELQEQVARDVAEMVRLLRKLAGEAEGETGIRQSNTPDRPPN